jgi:gliding motility-associated-like protein
MIVRDVNKCLSISPVLNFRVPPPIAVTFGTSSWGNYNISCKGYNDGSVWVKTKTGGRGFYKYKWTTADGRITGPDNTERLDNITAGTYTLVVTDTLGCSAPFSVVLTEPAGLSLDVLKVSHSADNIYNISCNGGSDGFIKMAISGGSGINTYRWTGPNGYTASSEDITGLKAGTYICRVSAGLDTSSCKLTPSPAFTLTEPAPIDISYTTSHSINGPYEINCNGGTGSIDITVTGGSVGNYTYVWTTSDGSGIVEGQADQPSLRSGTYHLAVKDLNGCSREIDITMKEPPVFGLLLTPSHITCITPGFNNGSVNLEVTGGVAPYSYSWSNGATTQDITGLTQGYYKVTASYNNTCRKTDSIRINLPPQLTFDKQIKSLNSYEISCYGRADGQVSVSATSGNAPFQYSWTGPNGFSSSLKDLTSLKAGEYYLKITDSNMCIATDTITMREPGPLGMTFALSSSNAGGFNINCAGDSTGLIIVQPINSVNNVSFLWADGFTGRTRQDLGAGSYSVIITDGNNCQASGTAAITQPDSIKLSFDIKNPFCPAMPDGSLSIAVTGGVKGADYLYKWSDNSTGNSLANIPEGFFKVRVEDLNGCVVRDSVFVEPQNQTCLGVPNIISPNGDLVNDYWIIDRKELYPNMEVRIFNRRGKLIWKSDKGYGKPWDGKSDGIDLPIDSYHYIIDLHDGSKPVLGTITIVK